MREVNTDLHFHGKFAGAVSEQMIPEVIAKQAPLKGLQLVGTGDILNERWIKLVKEQLTQENEGILSHGNGTKFFLQVEVEDINRVHHLAILPSFSKVYELRERFKGVCKDLDTDGRPKIRLNGEQIAEAVIEAGGMIGFSHAFTPFFGLYAHFNSYKQCYGSQAKNIHFMELGLSADTNMADRIEELHNLTFTSNSDAHCLHPDTPIVMKNGYTLPIKDIEGKAATGMLSLDLENDLKIKDSMPIKLVKKPSPPSLIEIKLRGDSLKVTPEHRFFMLNEGMIIERFAEDLKKGDLIAAVDKLPSEGKSAILTKPRITIYHKVHEEGLKLIREKRQNAGKRQIDIAKLLGIDEISYWKIENGKVKYREDFLVDICKFLDIEYDFFLQKYATDVYPKTMLPDTTSPGLCQLMGYALGDGCIWNNNKAKTLTITEKDFETLNKYKFISEKVFNDSGKISKCTSKNSYDIDLHAPIARFFEHTSECFAKHSKEKSVPELVFSLTRKEIAAFLRGFFDAEGTIEDHAVSACSSSLNMIHQISSLLLKLGIRSCIYPFLLEKSKQKYRHKVYVYGQYNLMLFRDLIGFENSNKSRDLDVYLKSLNQNPKTSFVDFMPIENMIKYACNVAEVNPSKIDKRLYMALRNFSLKKYHVKLFVEKMKNNSKLNGQLSKIRRFAESDITFEPITSIKRIKSDCEFVYDLCIPGYENYIANGVLVHNSPWPNKLGREFTRFRMQEISFEELCKALKREGGRGPTLNVKFNPLEGKYHLSRCNGCLLFFKPEIAAKLNWRCPDCKKTIKKGVDFRINELSGGRKLSHPDHRPKCLHTIPLSEIIAIAHGIKNAWSQKVQDMWRVYVDRFGNEITALIDTPIEELNKIDPKTAELVRLFREDKFRYVPGGAGVYGIPVPPNKPFEVKYYEARQKGLGEF